MQHTVHAYFLYIRQTWRMSWTSRSVSACSRSPEESGPVLTSSVELGVRGQLLQTCVFNQERQSSGRELVPVLFAAAVHNHQVSLSQVAHCA